MSKQLSVDNIKRFAFAGNAIITLQSGKTSKHFTYKITLSKNNDDLYFIRLLHGPDNESDYDYIGCYYMSSNYFHVAKPWKNVPSYTWPPALRAIKLFLDRIDNLPHNLYVYHEGRCGKCGKRLTTPESIERGLGPECYKEISKCSI